MTSPSYKTGSRCECGKPTRIALSASRRREQEAREYAQACADLVIMFGLNLPPNPPRWLYI